MDEMDSVYGGAGAPGRRTHLRDEIDVEIDEVFTRPGSSETDVSNSNLQALDENSLEFLTYENYLAEVASGTVDASLDEDTSSLHGGDREVEIEEPSAGEGAALEGSDASLFGDESTEDFESLLSEMASAIEHELEGDDEATENSEDTGSPARTTHPTGASSLELARGYFDVGLFEEALREFEKALAAGVETPSALLYMGRCLMELENWDQAVERLQQGMEAAAEDSALALEIRFELGVAYQDRGEGWMAYEVLGEVAQRDPTFRTADVTARLEQIAAQLGVGEG